MRMLVENDSFALRVFDFWLREIDLTGFKPSLAPTTEALNNNIHVQISLFNIFFVLLLFIETCIRLSWTPSTTGGWRRSQFSSSLYPCD